VGAHVPDDIVNVLDGEHDATRSAIVRTLRAYLDAHPQQKPRAEVQVARVSTTAGAHAREGKPCHRGGVGWSSYKRAQGGELSIERSPWRSPTQGGS
jgi:hypothetical protein